MASDNHAHYSRIGFTIVIGVAAIAATLVYMGGFHDANSEVIVETYYDTPVTGLSVGSPVNLFGVKIGEVREISFASVTYWGKGADTNDCGRVVILMALNKKRLGLSDVTTGDILAAMREHAYKGLRATVRSNGITGLSRIDLAMREDAPEVAMPKWEPRYPLVLPAPSLFDNFTVAATKLMNRLKTMDFDAVWSNVNRTADAAADLAEDAKALFDSSRTGIRQIVDDVGESSATIRELSTMLKNNPSLLIRSNDPEPLPETK